AELIVRHQGRKTMSVRRLIPMYLLILCVAAAGCGTSAKPGTDSERPAAARNVEAPGKTDEEAAPKEKADEDKVAEKAAGENQAAEKKANKENAAANSYVKVKVDVELRGVLTCTKKAATISIGKKKDEWVWVLDFREDKEMRAKAKALDGKTVLVQGSAN